MSEYETEGECPRCGGDTTVDHEASEELCVGEHGCLWWKNLETGEEFPSTS